MPRVHPVQISSCSKSAKNDSLINRGLAPTIQIEPDFYDMLLLYGVR